MLCQMRSPDAVSDILSQGTLGIWALHNIIVGELLYFKYGSLFNFVTWMARFKQDYVKLCLVQVIVLQAQFSSCVMCEGEAH